MRTIFILYDSADKPFVFRLAFELLAEGVPVCLDSYEMGPGNSLIASLDTALDSIACVLVVESSHSAATERVQYEVSKALEAEHRLGQRLLVPLRIDDSDGLHALKGRLHINLREDAAFMEGVHALIEHLRSLGLPAEPSGAPVLPLVFHKHIELDKFILERILGRWIGHGSAMDRPWIGMGRYRPRYDAPPQKRVVQHAAAPAAGTDLDVLVPARRDR